uniref:Uncharacterized protein n=1 Tax=Arundo donax TaxID=35708 RepID=A0A0A9BX49_ARUDO
MQGNIFLLTGRKRNSP